MEKTFRKNQEFVIIRKIGEGSYSSVFMVRRLSDNKIYAMKKVKLYMMNEKEKENSLNEVRILASLNDEFIVSYKEAFFENEDESMTLCLVMEFAAGGDLQEKLTNHIKNQTFFSEQEIWKAISQIVRGLKVLHDMQILHRDIKCQNIFLTKDEKFKLGDLNVSKVATQGFANTQTGTPYYASPEVWRDEAYNKKSDIWSLGCIIYEMCQLKPPFQAQNLDILFQKVQKGIYEKINYRYSKDLQNLVSACLSVTSQKRPSCDQIINQTQIQKQIKSDSRPTSGKQSKLLESIKIPTNLKLLKDKLPKSNYDQQEEGKGSQTIKRTPMSAQPFKRQLIFKNMQAPVQKPMTPSYHGRIQRLRQVKEDQQIKEIKPLLPKLQESSLLPKIEKDNIFKIYSKPPITQPNQPLTTSPNQPHLINSPNKPQVTSPNQPERAFKSPKVLQISDLKESLHIMNSKQKEIDIISKYKEIDIISKYKEFDIKPPLPFNSVKQSKEIDLNPPLPFNNSVSQSKEIDLKPPLPLYNSVKQTPKESNIFKIQKPLERPLSGQYQVQNYVDSLKNRVQTANNSQDTYQNQSQASQGDLEHKLSKKQQNLLGFLSSPQNVYKITKPQNIKKSQSSGIAFPPQCKLSQKEDPGGYMIHFQKEESRQNYRSQIFTPPIPINQKVLKNKNQSDMNQKQPFQGSQPLVIPIQKDIKKSNINSNNMKIYFDKYE